MPLQACFGSGEGNRTPVAELMRLSSGPARNPASFQAFIALVTSIIGRKKQIVNCLRQQFIVAAKAHEVNFAKWFLQLESNQYFSLMKCHSFVRVANPNY